MWAIQATTEECVLAEGPVWDAQREVLHWVDIHSGTVFTGRLLPDGQISTVDKFELGQTVGAVAPDGAGNLLIAGSKRLYLRSSTGALTTGLDLLPRWSHQRLNDGKPDPAGHLIVGSLNLNGDSTTEELFYVGAKGSALLDADLTLSNGLAWTADGTVMYSIDTLRHTVYARSYDSLTGRTGPRQTALIIDDGYPDGMCLDAAEHLWIAIWGRGEVRRYSPEGVLEQIIKVPAPHTSSVTFAGPQLDTLVITTATQDLTTEQQAEYPLSGTLFTVKPGVSGLPQPLWNGAFESAEGKAHP